MTTPTPQDAALQDVQEAAESRAGQEAAKLTRQAWSRAALAGVTAVTTAGAAAVAAATDDSPLVRMNMSGVAVTSGVITIGSGAMAAAAAMRARERRRQQEHRRQDIELNDVGTRAAGAGHSASESLPSRPPAAHLPSRPAQGSSGRGR